MKTVEPQKDEQGRWVGDDGYIVPATFAEFYERHPDFASTMARKWLRYGNPDEVEDLAQDIWHRLLHLRAVERFDPSRMFGVSRHRFFFYITRCARNTANSRWRSECREPSVSDDAVGIGGDVESIATVTEEHVHANRAVSLAPWNPDDAIWLDGFRRWLTEHGHGEYISIMDAVLTEGTLTGAGEFLRLPSRAIHWRMRRLRELGGEYQRRKLVREGVSH